MSADIRKKNLTEMLHLTYKEMKRIQGLKCPADIKMVEDHTKSLKDLDRRTIRIEAMAVATVIILTLLGGWEYFKDKDKAKKEAESNKYTELVRNANR